MPRRPRLSKRERRPRFPRRELIPLLHVLNTLKPEHRIILLAHFDDKTRDGLYQTIQKVLVSDRMPLRKRLFLKTKLAPYKREFLQLARDARSNVKKKKTLTQVGGSPMRYVLQAAIPLLLNTFR